MKATQLYRKHNGNNI